MMSSIHFYVFWEEPNFHHTYLFKENTKNFVMILKIFLNKTSSLYLILYVKKPQVFLFL